MKLFILHSGKENDSEIGAFTTGVQNKDLKVFSRTIRDHKRPADPKNHVVWCIMGFNCSVFRHGMSFTTQYLYPSVAARRQKTSLKATAMAPNLRTFQNESMRELKNIVDGVDSLIFQGRMPDGIFSSHYSLSQSLPSDTFCPIGEIPRERDIHDIRADFRSARRTLQTRVLAGTVQKKISNPYQISPGRMFTCKLPQRDALQVVRNCRFSVSTIPHTRPYEVQAAKKPLEYAALEKGIICNDSPSNLNASATDGILCKVTRPDIFTDFDHLSEETVPANDPSVLEDCWRNNVTASSGVDHYVIGACAFSSYDEVSATPVSSVTVVHGFSKQTLITK
jgi:hypothetical protein